MNAIATKAPLYRPQIKRAHQVMGALRFPLFLLVWSLGVILLTGSYLPAGALVRQAPVDFEELAKLPTLSDTKALNSVLEVHLQQADVTSGRWHPQAMSNTEKVVTQASQPEPATRVEVSAQTAPLGVSVAAMNIPSIEPQLLVKSVRMRKSGVGSDPNEGVQKRSLVEGSQRDTIAPLMGRTLLAKREARVLLAAGRVLPAYQLLFAEMAGGAQDVEFLGLFAVAAYGSGRPAQALLVYERLLTLEPDNERWSVGLGLCRERLGMDALPVYEKVVAQAVSDSAVHTIARERLQDLG